MNELLYALGDTSKVLQAVLRADGVPIDLTGATVLMRICPVANVNVAAWEWTWVVEDGAGGVVTYQPGIGDGERTPGRYRGKFTVTGADGGRLTVPDDDRTWIPLRIARVPAGVP